jgi:hypothetical protein
MTDAQNQCVMSLLLLIVLLLLLLRLMVAMILQKLVMRWVLIMTPRWITTDTQATMDGRR